MTTRKCLVRISSWWCNGEQLPDTAAKLQRERYPQRRSDCIFHDSACQSFQSQGTKVAAANEAVLVPCRKHVNLPVAGQDLTLDELWKTLLSDKKWIYAAPNWMYDTKQKRQFVVVSLCGAAKLPYNRSLSTPFHKARGVKIQWERAQGLRQDRRVAH